jgi:hypothetical protein
MDLTDERWGVLCCVPQAFVTDLKERGGLGLSERFIDGTFVVPDRGCSA